jgi:hypothetical protein
MAQNKLDDENYKPPKAVLIVGDWVIDEHWLVGIHRSRTSTRVGQVHYRTIQTLQSTVMALCGAGRTAGILYRARAQDKPLYDVIGIGLWHVQDTEYLQGMLDPNAIKRRTPHQINLRYNSNENKPTLMNLVEKNADHSPGTTKVIRLYQQTGPTIKLVERIDWELQAPELGWYSRGDLDRNLALQEILRKNKPIAIVVHDFLKGTLSPDLVKFLVQRLPKAEWFICSKSFEPIWREKIPIDRIRLIEVPEAAMRNAVETKRIPDTWLTKQGMPTKAALSLLNELAEKYFNATFIAVPDDHTILAHRGGPPFEEKEGAFWVNREKDVSPVGLPMSSVCFAAFIAHMLSGPQETLKSLVDHSASFTQAWRDFARGRLETPIEWDPVREPRLDVTAPANSRISSEALSWTDDLNRWKAGYDDKTLGVIKNDGKLYIELWRAMTLVKNYICIADSKRKVLRQIVDELEAFRREQRPRSCMIIATPGSGKSLLAERLAEDHGLQYLEFNITQMIEKSDLLDCFDVILTTQFENRGKRLLVFVDEIDAHLAGEPVYEMFLSVLERGVYRRAGKTFPIQPCFWLFAGTADPSKKAQDRKGNDFVSRLTLKPLTMEVGEDDKWRLENVYLGAALLRLEFPDVREVSTEVLELFYSLPARLSIRELRQFVRDFVDIRSGQVRWQNVPQSWYERLKIKEHEPPSKETMVEIRGDASRPTVVARLTPGSLMPPLSDAKAA